MNHQDKFLRHIWECIEYAENEDRWPTTREKLQGLAFSILVAIDGEAVEVPGYQMIPISKSNMSGEDIAGSLHERFGEVKP